MQFCKIYDTKNIIQHISFIFKPFLQEKRPKTEFCDIFLYNGILERDSKAARRILRRAALCLFSQLNLLFVQRAVMLAGSVIGRGRIITLAEAAPRVRTVDFFVAHVV